MKRLVGTTREASLTMMKNPTVSVVGPAMSAIQIPARTVIAMNNEKLTILSNLKEIFDAEPESTFIKAIYQISTDTLF
jgi:hypothetical protein